MEDDIERLDLEEDEDLTNEDFIDDYEEDFGEELEIDDED